MSPTQNEPPSLPLTFRRFQVVAAHRNNSVYPLTCQQLPFIALALAGEAGELANRVKKVWRGTADITDPEVKAAILSEFADVMTYAVIGIEILGADSETVLREKFSEVSRRPEVQYGHEL